MLQASIAKDGNLLFISCVINWFVPILYPDTKAEDNIVMVTYLGS